MICQEERKRKLCENMNEDLRIMQEKGSSSFMHHYLGPICAGEPEKIAVFAEM